MKIGDIVYYVDKEMKFYFDMKILKIINDKKYNCTLYKCQIVGNKYKFLNKQFEFKKEKIGKISVYSKLNLCSSLDEAELFIN